MTVWRIVEDMTLSFDSQYIGVEIFTNYSGQAIVAGRKRSFVELDARDLPP